MNNVSLSGRTTRDIELRFTPAGKAVANGTIAVQRKFKNQNGDYEADFIDFVAWGKTGELLAQYVKKGDHFSISGNLQTRVWVRTDGSRQKTTEVNVQDFDFPVKPKREQSSPRQTEPQQPTINDPFANDGQPINISDDDLPF